MRPTHPISTSILFLAGTLWAAAAQGQTTLLYDTAADALVASFHSVPGELAEPDPTPLVRVYGDGKVRVHQPAYMKQAGDYELQLSPTELEALLQSLVAKGLVRFDAEATRKSQRQQVASRAAQARARGTSPTVFFEADASTSIFQLNLDSVAQADADTTLTNLQKTVSWRGLHTDAERFPEVGAIQDLLSAEQELRALANRSDLVRIP